MTMKVNQLERLGACCGVTRTRARYLRYLLYVPCNHNSATNGVG